MYVHSSPSTCFKQQLCSLFDCSRLFKTYDSWKSERTATFWTRNVHLSQHEFQNYHKKMLYFKFRAVFFLLNRCWFGFFRVVLWVSACYCVIAYIWEYICDSGQLGRWYHSWGFQLNSRKLSPSAREDNLSYMKSPTSSLKSAFSHTSYPQPNFKIMYNMITCCTNTYTHTYICSFIMEF